MCYTRVSHLAKSQLNCYRKCISWIFNKQLKEVILILIHESAETRSAWHRVIAMRLVTLVNRC